MWAKPLLLSAFVAVSAASAQLETTQVAQLAQPGWMVPTQDRRGDRPQNIRSLREVVDELRARYGGELISARLEDGPRPIYVLRWRMPNGDVRDFRVDAAR
jgi:uncharacterized membrane protein YkoI